MSLRTGGGEHGRETRRIFPQLLEMGRQIEKFYGRLPKETEGRLWSWNQVLRGAQQDKEKSLLFWGFSTVEDREADSAMMWRVAERNRRSFIERESGASRS
jgi:hypothetical protein